MINPFATTRRAVPAAALTALVLAGCQTTPTCPHCGVRHEPHYHAVPYGSHHALPDGSHYQVMPGDPGLAIPPGSNGVEPAPAAEPPPPPAPILRPQSSRLKGMKRTARAVTTTDSPLQPIPETESIGSSSEDSPGLLERLQSGFRDLFPPALQ